MAKWRRGGRRRSARWEVIWHDCGPQVDDSGAAVIGPGLASAEGADGRVRLNLGARVVDTCPQFIEALAEDCGTYREQVFSTLAAPAHAWAAEAENRDAL